MTIPNQGVQKVVQRATLVMLDRISNRTSFVQKFTAAQACNKLLNQFNKAVVSERNLLDGEALEYARAVSTAKKVSGAYLNQRNFSKRRRCSAERYGLVRVALEQAWRSCFLYKDQMGYLAMKERSA